MDPNHPHGPRDIYEQMWNLKGPMEREMLGGYDTWRRHASEHMEAANRAARTTRDQTIAAELRAIAEEIGTAYPGEWEIAHQKWIARLTTIASRLEE